MVSLVPVTNWLRQATCSFTPAHVCVRERELMIMKKRKQSLKEPSLVNTDHRSDECATPAHYTGLQPIASDSRKASSTPKSSRQATPTVMNISLSWPAEETIPSTDLRGKCLPLLARR
ncbi:hypothetical protein AAFF_G00123010 [Aldrovandia affinis]|uniref:Uncharacterized protein n=1 Tax=Aldrovandia affinis TaxID=143900 RepID=A0AAD7RRV8_9TELE|nr:hypothetical protein AAFF_G00123010 [Aldrovandia affinis]